MSGPSAAWLAALPPEGPHRQRDLAVRQAVRLRARLVCEYCIMPDDGGFEIEHIIPPRRWPDYVANRLPHVPYRSGRRGPDHVDNYAWSCRRCNSPKGERIQHQAAGGWFRLFDPRHDRWPDHFRLSPSGLIIIPISPIGTATRSALKLNGTEADLYALELRALLIKADAYPPVWATTWRV
jgi:5-methylcytosine-specific restriction endonuclease McrA